LFYLLRHKRLKIEHDEDMMSNIAFPSYRFVVLMIKQISLSVTLRYMIV